MESEQIPEENGSLPGDVNEDTNTNSSMSRHEVENENSNVSSARNEEEDSRYVLPIIYYMNFVYYTGCF